VIGFVLDRGRVRSFDVPGDGTLTFLSGISNRGRLVGLYDNPNAEVSAQRSRATAMPLLDALSLGLAEGNESR
jgi:hypothetical protein